MIEINRIVVHHKAVRVDVPINDNYDSNFMNIIDPSSIWWCITLNQFTVEMSFLHRMCFLLSHMLNFNDDAFWTKEWNWVIKIYHHPELEIVFVDVDGEKLHSRFVIQTIFCVINHKCNFAVQHGIAIERKEFLNENKCLVRS